MIRRVILLVSAAFILTTLPTMAASGHNNSAKAFSISTAQETTGAKYEMTAAEVKKRLAKGHITVLDVRGDVGGEMIKGAQHVPLAKLDDWAKGHSKSTLVVSYCTCAHDEAAESATGKLRGMGFTQAFTLKGGLQAAKTAGIAVGPPSE